MQQKMNHLVVVLLTLGVVLNHKDCHTRGPSKTQIPLIKSFFHPTAPQQKAKSFSKQILGTLGLKELLFIQKLTTYRKFEPREHHLKDDLI